MTTATIGICVRNCELTIEDTIRSILDQTYPKSDLEIIFVDDGSTDRTLQIINSFYSRIDTRTKIFHQSWKGLGTARNVIVDNASGRYIVWIDGDMTIEKVFIAKQVEYMEQNPRVGAAKGHYGSNKSANVIVQLESLRPVLLKKDSQRLFGTGGSIYRVKAIKEVGGFDNRITGAGEDIDALARMVKKGWNLSLSDGIFYEKYEESIRSLWLQYYWYGYGAHYVRHKHKQAVSFALRIPPIAFVVGLGRFFLVFKLDQKAIYLLLPGYELFKGSAWCLGFAASHSRKFGHHV